jgi:hypothetical protein
VVYLGSDKQHDTLACLVLHSSSDFCIKSCVIASYDEIFVKMWFLVVNLIMFNENLVAVSISCDNNLSCCYKLPL